MDLYQRFSEIFQTRPAFLVKAPGRVNLLGEHVDYNDGPVLPAAIDRYVSIAAASSGDGLVSLAALDLGQTVQFALDELDQKKALGGEPLPDWARYPAGVAWSLLQSGFPVSGLRAAYTSSVPIGAGLSSSAAVEVGFGALWQALDGWEASPLEVAQYCQQAENRYVGVACGLMDQFASACGVEGHALYFDTRSLEYHPVPLPPGTAIVVADSGMRRSLVTSAYNERRAACEQAVHILQEKMPGIHSLRDISPLELAAYSSLLPENVRRRAEHVVKEIARVQSAVQALERGKWQAFSALMAAGHTSLRDLYEVSLPELDGLVEIAREQPGCLGARLTGAGFGGCTVNLVDEKAVEAFAQALVERYRSRFSKDAQVYACRASQGAWVERL